MTTPLILVSSQVKNFDQYMEDLENDLAPRIDYMEICQKLGGEVSGYGLFQTYWYALGRKFEKMVRLDLFESFMITRQLSKHNLVLSASEKTAIPLTMLLSSKRKTVPHVVISHHLSSKNKSRLFRIWQIYKNFHQIICVSKMQADYAIQKLHIPASRVHFVFDKVDHRFFRPMEDEVEDFVLAVGQEQRDYKTLQKALAGTGIKLIVVASSHWSNYRLPGFGDKNIQIVKNIPYTLLRSLYARARLVVIPLNCVDYAAGANAILEAMAMGKPVIVSQTPGIAEYIEDGKTGVFVPPGDPAALRAKIASLWEDVETQTDLGTNARWAIENNMNLDIYVEQVVNIIQNALETTHPTKGP